MRTGKLLSCVLCACFCGAALALSALADGPTYEVSAKVDDPAPYTINDAWSSHTCEYDIATDMHYYRFKPANTGTASQITKAGLSIPLPATASDDGDYAYMKLIVRTNISGCKPRFVMYKYYASAGGDVVSQAGVFDASAAITGNGTWQSVYIKLEKTGYEFKQFALAPLGPLRGNAVPDLENAYYDIAAFAFFKNKADAFAYDLAADCKDGTGGISVPGGPVGTIALRASASSITQDGGTVTLTPYLTTTSGDVLDASTCVDYVTDSINATLDVHPDGTATLQAKMNGKMTVRIVYRDEPSVYAETTVNISGQSERIPSRSVKWVSYGNSIHKHAPSPGIGWMDDWGMAATAEEKDYVHVLWKMLENKYGAGNVEHVFGEGQSAFESGLASRTADFDYVTYLADLEAFIAREQPDIVTVQYGENVKSVSAEIYALGFEAFVDAVRRGAPDCIVLVAKPVWSSDFRSAGTDIVGRERDVVIADLSQFNKSRYKAIGVYENAALSNHPNDLGMQAIAKEMYEQLNKRLTSDFDKRITYAVTPFEIGFENETRAITVDGGTLDLAPYLLPADAAQEFIFTSSDNTVATVDERGVVTAAGNGSVTITAVARYMATLVARAVLTVSGQTAPYVLTYDKNTGDTVTGMPAVNTAAKLTVVLSDAIPVRETYRFLGWSLTPDGATVGSVEMTKDTTVYAIWEKATRWDFERDNDKEGFTVDNGFNQYVFDGRFMMIATDTDEAHGNILTVHSPAVSVDPSEYDRLRITMQNTNVSSASSLRLTVRTTGGTSSFSLPVTSTAASDYVFDLSGLSGKVTGFSFKPTDIDATVFLEEIAFENSQNAQAANTCVVEDKTRVTADIGVDLRGHSGNATALLGLYGEDGRLNGVKIVALNGGVFNKNTVVFTAPDAVGAVRLFVLDALLRPVRAAETLFTAGERP